MNLQTRAFKMSLFDSRRLVFAVAVAAFLVSVTEIIDGFELPFETAPAHLLSTGSLVSVGFVTSTMASLGYLGLFLLMVLESASLPIPSEVILPFAGFLVFRGSMSFAPVVLISTSAGLVGALVDYYVALKLGRPVVERLFKLSGAKPEHLGRAEAWLSDKGSWSILLARFVPGLRSSVSIPAGALRMKLWTFLGMTLIGCLGWSMVLVYLGYSAGSLWQAALVKPAPLLTELVLVGIAAASSVYIVISVHRRVSSARQLDNKDSSSVRAGQSGAGD